MRCATTFTIIIGAALFALAAHAQTPGQPRFRGRVSPDPFEAGFALVDANRDGRVTREEAYAQLRRRMTEADANRDGAIDQAEFAALASTPLNRKVRAPQGPLPPATSGLLQTLFWLADTNRDGHLAFEEARGFLDGRFPAFDRNRDGGVTREEARNALSSPTLGLLGPPSLPRIWR